MAITFVGGATASAASGGDPTLTFPGGVAVNDLAILAYAIGDNDGVDFNMTQPTGYTEVADLFADDTQDTNLGVYWALVTQGMIDAGTQTVDGQGGSDAAVAAVIMFFRGVDTTTPMDVTPTTATGINSNVPDPPAITHNGTSGIVTVAVGAFGHTSGGAVTVTAPANYTTNAQQKSQDDTSDITIGMGYNTVPDSPTHNPTPFTPSIADSTSHSWCAVTIAIRPASSGTTFDQALTSTIAAVTTTIVRQVNKPITITSATTAVISRQTNKSITSTVGTATATIQKQVNKAITTATNVATATIATVKTFAQLLTATSSSVATMHRQINKLLTASAPTTATITRSVNFALTAVASSVATIQKTITKPLTIAISVVTATMIKGFLFTRTLTTTVATATATMVRETQKNLTTTVSTSIASIQRQVNKVLTATSASTATIQKTIGTSIFALASSLSTIQKEVNKPLTTGANVATATIARAITFGKVLSTTVSTSTTTIVKSVQKSLTAEATSLASIQRQVNKTLSALASSSATIQRQISKSLSAVSTSIASILAEFQAAGGQVFEQAMTATASVTVSIIKSVSFAMNAGGTVLATITKSVSKTLMASATSLATILTPKIIVKILSVTSAATATVVKTVQKQLAAASTAASSVQKTVSKLLTATSLGTATMAAIDVFISGVLTYVKDLVRLTRVVQGVVAKQVFWGARVRLNVARIATNYALNKKISMRVVAPVAQGEKLGTNILIEATFTDRFGVLYNPDGGTVKMFRKKPDGTYYSTDNPVTETGVTMTNQSTGVYQANFQSATTDPSGGWVFECQGKVGSEKAFNDIKIQFRV